MICLGLRLAVQTSHQVYGFISLSPSWPSWLATGGGRALPLAAGCVVSPGEEQGPVAILLLLVISPLVPNSSWILALVRLSFSEANRIHSTSLAEAKGFNVELLAHVIWDSYQSLGWKVWW